MMIFRTIPILLGFIVPTFGWSNQLIPLDVGIKSTPGFHCRTVGLVMVYGGANLSSKILGRTQNFIAVTGKEVNGFLPIITGVGVRGWVVSNQVYSETGTLGPCKVQLLPDGRLLFGWS